MASDGHDAALYQALTGLNQAVNNLNQTVARVFPAAGGTSTTASAGAATLPANPVGFITVTLPNGTAAKIPYYI